jgi:hypothetical protein
VDIPAAYCSRSKGARNREIENLPLFGGQAPGCVASLEALGAPEFAAALFLNCTKNIELTPRHFLRTFSIALQKNYELLQPETPLESGLHSN